MENQIDMEMERLANAPKIEKYMIPDGAFYMILSKDYVPKEGDLKKRSLLKKQFCMQRERLN